MPSELLPTGEAAKRLGIHRGTLVRWREKGLVTPAYVTPGGHARWDLDDLLKQLRDNPPRDE